MTMIGQAVQFVLDEVAAQNVQPPTGVDGYKAGTMAAAIITAENGDGTQDLLLLLNRQPQVCVMRGRRQGTGQGTWRYITGQRGGA